jgi:hypothetical protein
MKYKKILLKLSGEALMGDRQYGIDPVRLAEYAEEIKKIHDKGIEIAIVIGGGNIFRGVAGASNGMDRMQRLYGNASHCYQRNGFTRFIRRQRNANAFANCIKNQTMLNLT